MGKSDSVSNCYKDITWQVRTTSVISTTCSMQEDGTRWPWPVTHQEAARSLHIYSWARGPLVSADIFRGVCRSLNKTLTRIYVYDTLCPQQMLVNKGGQTMNVQLITWVGSAEISQP